MCDLGFEPTSGHIVLQKRTSPVVQAILREQGVVEMLAKSVHELRRDDAEVMTHEFVQLGQGLRDGTRALFGMCLSKIYTLLKEAKLPK